MDKIYDADERASRYSEESILEVCPASNGRAVLSAFAPGFLCGVYREWAALRTEYSSSTPIEVWL
jgi:hypothetical protein